ncbi:MULTISPECIES: 4Fe-4S dicluster domain-containing protein [unclassified Microbulbifer]|uniref:4Fe-4S dicluster domain-containing protein n=1 Tax=unclassified Microbulbifer TaxID=2619833 RepID=UPI0027E4D9E1|nr:MULTISPECIES: 4Fe-4S dicluster domain-containing protein [unclassified Microbulbifer]
MQESVLQAENLDLLLQAIRAEGYQLLGPVLRDRAIVYDEIETAADLPRGWTDEQEKGYYRVVRRDDGAYFGYAAGPHSWKKFLQLPRRQVWRAQKKAAGIQVTEIVDEAPSMAFLGVRSCELHAIATQDRVFVDDRYRNDSYAQRRGSLFIVAINCTSTAATCFCTSMNTGPEVTLPNDLKMTEVIGGGEHFFLISSGSEKGEKILRQLPLEASDKRHRKAGDDAIQQAVQQMREGPRNFDSSDLKELLYRNYESPSWDQVAERCLSCANCTMACPTCFCSTVEDTTDLSGEHAQRWERWDSCFTADFSYITGGPVRPDTRSRYRQWMTHKLATWYDQFGTSGCVGCGRCIAWCPVGIDITEEVQRIQEAEKP